MFNNLITTLFFDGKKSLLSVSKYSLNKLLLYDIQVLKRD